MAPDCDRARRIARREFVFLSNGSVGLLDEHCCHRGASYLGAGGELRVAVIYHGWLFAADGTVETPTSQSQLQDTLQGEGLSGP